MAKTKPTNLERLQEIVDTKIFLNDECIEAPFKGRNNGGYPSVSFNGKACGAHRAIFQIFHKVDLSGSKLCVMHTCDNRSCVNPLHLVAGTYSENSRDMHAKGRGNYGNRTLNMDKARAIRKERAEGVPMKELAVIYGVAFQTIHNVLIHKIWKEKGE